MNLLAFRILCPESLRFTGSIVCDHTVCRVQDVLGGTVILLQTDDFCIWKNVLKSKNISNICSTEFIDRLVIITDDTEIPISGSQKTYKFKLRSIGILILIYMIYLKRS